VNALGFIFYEKSPRRIDPSKAAGIIKLLPSSVTPIGVFVNEKRETIEGIIRQTHIRGIQLSGDESPDECDGFTVPTWKAFRIRDVKDVGQIKDYKVSAVMLDGSSDKEYGGSGKLADFSVAIEMKRYNRIILSGGLSPENISDAIERVQPYGVDVNSGIEITPGKKNPSDVKLLFDQLK
jgi:phosphoribosylanthranilate isomerase